MIPETTELVTTFMTSERKKHHCPTKILTPVCLQKRTSQFDNTLNEELPTGNPALPSYPLVGYVETVGNLAVLPTYQQKNGENPSLGMKSFCAQKRAERLRIFRLLFMTIHMHKAPVCRHIIAIHRHIF